MRAFKRIVALLTIIMMVSCRVLPDLNLDGAGRAQAVQIQNGTTASTENRTASSDGSVEVDASGSLEASTETGEGGSADSTEEAEGSLEDSTETGESGTGEDSTETGESGTGEDSTETGESGTGEDSTENGESGTGEDSTENGESGTGEDSTENGESGTGEDSTEADESVDDEESTEVPTEAPTEAPTQAPTLPPETVPVGATEENNSGNGGNSGGSGNAGNSGNTGNSGNSGNSGNTGGSGIGGNGGSTRPDTSALDNVVNENKYKPSAPKKEVEEDKQVDSSIYEKPADKAIDILKDEAQDCLEKAWDAETERLMKESMEKMVAGKEKVFIAQVEKPTNMSSMLDEGKKLIAEGEDLAKQADFFKKVSNVSDLLDYASAAADMYSVYQDIEGIMNPNNEHATFQVLETTALAADAVLGVLSIAATVTGAFSPPGLALSLTIGVASAFLHSEGFADWANSIDSGLLDAIDSFFKKLLPWMKSPDDVGCYKPNIYLYSDIEREVEIRFKFPGLLTVTIPEYGSGWEVDTGLDGVLYGENGEEYSFLFYESITQKGLFQTEEGFEIPADQRNVWFEEILSAMGFNEAEIADFTAFWNEKLDAGVDYIMYPQDTETVDIAMPIVVNPMPESVERIWFVFEADEGQAVTEPKIEAIDRDSDYALVEWGGMIFE